MGELTSPLGDEGPPRGARSAATDTSDPLTYRQRCLKQQGTEPPRYDRHCQTKGCMCHHETCYKGWVDHEGGTMPCDICRIDLWARWFKREELRAAGYPGASLSAVMTPTPTAGTSRAR